MNKKYQLTFYKADFIQYNRILEDAEIRAMVSGFLLKYISLEAFYKKMLITYKESTGKKLTAKEKDRLEVKIPDVKEVLDYFNVPYDEQLLGRVFGSNDKNYMECSIKKLRNRFVHHVNENVLRVIMERYDSINRDLDAFAQILG